MLIVSLSLFFALACARVRTPNRGIGKRIRSAEEYDGCVHFPAVLPLYSTPHWSQLLLTRSSIVTLNGCGLCGTAVFVCVCECLRRALRSVWLAGRGSLCQHRVGNSWPLSVTRTNVLCRDRVIVRTVYAQAKISSRKTESQQRFR